jgi:hypothetical protein
VRRGAPDAEVEAGDLGRRPGHQIAIQAQQLAPGPVPAWSIVIATSALMASGWLA